jgi:hypothetical protein
MRNEQSVVRKQTPAPTGMLILTDHRLAGKRKSIDLDGFRLAVAAIHDSGGSMRSPNQARRYVANTPRKRPYYASCLPPRPRPARARGPASPGFRRRARVVRWSPTAASPQWGGDPSPMRGGAAAPQGKDGRPPQLAAMPTCSGSVISLREAIGCMMVASGCNARPLAMRMSRPRPAR